MFSLPRNKNSKCRKRLDKRDQTFPETRDIRITEAEFGQYSSFSKVILIVNSEMCSQPAETSWVKLEAVLKIEDRFGLKKTGIKWAINLKSPNTVGGFYLCPVRT
jgi:hypothetical protein